MTPAGLLMQQAIASGASVHRTENNRPVIRLVPREKLVGWLGDVCYWYGSMSAERTKIEIAPGRQGAKGRDVGHSAAPLHQGERRDPVVPVAVSCVASPLLVVTRIVILTY